MSAPIDGTFSSQGSSIDSVDSRHTVLDRWAESRPVARRSPTPESLPASLPNAVTATALALLGQMDQAILMVNRRGSVCYANNSARRLLEQRTDVRLEHDHLVCHAKEDQQILDKVLDTMPWGHDENPNTNQVCRLGHEDSALIVVARLVDSGTGTNGSEQMGLFVVHRTVEPSTPHVSGLLRQAFGLTRAEAAVATMIAGGDTPAEIAGHRNVSVETVRAQLRVLYAKTKTNRQAELVRLVHRVTYLT